MSTLTGKQDETVLRSEKDLEGYFERFSKPISHRKVGLEAEFFAVDRTTGRALPYDGPGGIEDILRRLASRFSYEALLDGERIIGLRGRDKFVSLEPGGQMELSAPPVANVFQIKQQIESFFGELGTVSKEFFPSVTWISAGIQPFSSLQEVPWVPKKRYAIMAEYFRTRGALSHEMMKLTATNQINLDYLDEADALAGLRTVLGITSIVTALFAHSSFSEGQPNGFMSRRLHIWNHTDPDRAGLLLKFIRTGRKFRDYLDYLLEMPVIFVVREGAWIPLQGVRFRNFIKEGFQGLRATMSDFELHLSTAFPEARFKQYLEVRGIDAQPPELIPAVAAFWKGILYGEEAREQAWRLVESLSEEERRQLHAEIPRMGLRTKLRGKPIFEIAEKLVDLSCASLARQGREEHFDECQFLKQIRGKILNPGKSPAETLLEKWNGELAQDPKRLIDYLGI